MVVKLESSDGQEFVVEAEIANKSVLLRNILDDIGEFDDALHLPNVTGPILNKVIEYCTYHRKDPIIDELEPVVQEVAAEEEIEEWDREFCKVDKAVLFDLVLAANYLDIKTLIVLTCKTVANMIKGKSIEEIRIIFTPDNVCIKSE